MRGQDMGWIAVGVVAVGVAGWQLKRVPEAAPVAVEETTAIAERTRKVDPDARGTPTRPNVPAAAWRDAGDGVRVADIEVGEGEDIGAGSLVRVDYAMWSKDGALLQTSWSERVPTDVAPGTGQVVPGFETTLQGMRVGGRRYASIPAAQGYGRGGGRGIPSDTDLFLLVHLVEVTAIRVVPTTPPAADRPWRDVADGVRVRDVEPGKGAALVAGAKVRLDWTAWDANGALIDSTLRRGAAPPYTLGAGSLPDAIEAAVVGMASGGRRHVELAAGAFWPAETRPAAVGEADRVRLELAMVAE